MLSINACSTTIWVKVQFYYCKVTHSIKKWFKNSHLKYCWKLYRRPSYQAEVSNIYYPTVFTYYFYECAKIAKHFTYINNFGCERLQT